MKTAMGISALLRVHLETVAVKSDKSHLQEIISVVTQRWGIILT